MGILQGTHWFIQWAAQEAIDSGNCSVRIFFADFAKCFDIIDHSTLLDELRSFNVDQLCFFGYAASLPTEHRAVRVGSSLSSWKQVNGGVPQGKKTRINALYCHDK